MEWIEYSARKLNEEERARKREEVVDIKTSTELTVVPGHCCTHVMAIRFNEQPAFIVIVFAHRIIVIKDRSCCVFSGFSSVFSSMGT